MIRAHKTTPNADATRTLIFGVVVAICIIVGLDPAVVLWERYASHRPWITASIEIVPSQEGKPNILYKPMARFPVNGTWTAFLQTESGMRTRSGKGEGDYKPNDRPPQLWAWADWLGFDPPEPREPYQACVFYHAQSDRGVWDQSDPVCSPFYDPVTRRTLK